MTNSIKVGTITNSNPSLWLDTNTLGTDKVVYQISTARPSGQQDWMSVNQFCSVLSIYWLENTPSPPFGLKQVNDKEKIAMAEVLISYGSMDEQVTYAERRLSGRRQRKDDVVKGVEGGTYAAGTRIWAGNDLHVIGARVTSTTEFQLYDSNTGKVTTYPRAKFGQVMNSMRCNVFVVAS